MEPRKFDYLETIREKIELQDFEELDEFIEDIKEDVKGDPDFKELLEELKSKRYDDVTSLIDEIMFKDMQAEFEEFYKDGEFDQPNGKDEDLDLEMGFDERDSENITFESFDEENYYNKDSDDDN